MRAQLIFIHCEKSAGTSQRALLTRNYGRERIFWLGLDDNELQQRAHVVAAGDYIVVGGHICYTDFLNSPRRFLFTSVVREPIGRAVSLYYYFCESAPEKTKTIWRTKGLDKNSMFKTIENVPGFRNLITNMQCYRLSGTRQFGTTTDVLNTDNFLVGCFGDLNSFNSRLGALLNWRHGPLERHNATTQPGYQDTILAEPGLRDLIRELNQEDIALYEFISKQGVHEHLPDKKIFKKHLAAKRSATENELSTADLPNIRLEIPGSTFLELRHKTHITVRLVNNSKMPLSPSGQHPFIVAYHWCNTNGDVLEWEGARTPLPRNVAPGETTNVGATIIPPKSLPPGNYKIRFGLLQRGVRWLETLDDSHTTEIDMCYTDQGSGRSYNIDSSKGSSTARALGQDLVKTVFMHIRAIVKSAGRGS